MHAVCLNRHTGSIVMTYDPSLLSPDAVREGLRQFRAAGAEAGCGEIPRWVETIDARLLEALVEKVVIASIAAVV